MHTARFAWYLFRLALYNGAGFLRFVSKPGSRVIFPLVLIALAFLLRAPLHSMMAAEARLADPGYQPESVVLDGGIVVFVIALSILYALTSKLLALMVGAFPVAMRPLPPQRKLSPTKTEIKPAVVRVVVPPLPKQRA